MSNRHEKYCFWSGSRLVRSSPRSRPWLRHIRLRHIGIPLDLAYELDARNPHPLLTDLGAGMPMPPGIRPPIFNFFSDSYQ